MTRIVNVSRRAFLKGASAATGGLVLGVSMPVFDAFGQQVDGDLLTVLRERPA